MASEAWEGMLLGLACQGTDAVQEPHNASLVQQKGVIWELHDDNDEDDDAGVDVVVGPLEGSVYSEGSVVYLQASESQHHKNLVGGVYLAEVLSLLAAAPALDLLLTLVVGVVCGEPAQESCDVHIPGDADSRLALSVDVSLDVGSEGGGSEGEGSGGEGMGMEECGRELDGSGGDEYELWEGGGEEAVGDGVGNCGYKRLVLDMKNVYHVTLGFHGYSAQHVHRDHDSHDLEIYDHHDCVQYGNLGSSCDYVGVVCVHESVVQGCEHGSDLPHTYCYSSRHGAQNRVENQPQYA